jgi:hypothetical protein
LTGRPETIAALRGIAAGCHSDAVLDKGGTSRPVGNAQKIGAGTVIDPEPLMRTKDAVKSANATPFNKVGEKLPASESKPETLIVILLAEAGRPGGGGLRMALLWPKVQVADTTGQRSRSMATLSDG